MKLRSVTYENQFLVWRKRLNYFMENEKSIFELCTLFIGKIYYVILKNKIQILFTNMPQNPWADIGYLLR